MKRIKVYAAMLLAAVLAVGFVGCDPKQEDPESWFDILGSNNEAFPTTLNVAYGGYTYDLKISSNLSWTITSDADWVHVDVVLSRFETSIYVNGVKQAEQNSGYRIETILGSSFVGNLCFIEEDAVIVIDIIAVTSA